MILHIFVKSYGVLKRKEPVIFSIRFNDPRRGLNRPRPVPHYEIQFAREAANGNAAKQILQCTNSGGNLLSYTKNVRLHIRQGHHRVFQKRVD